MAPERHERSSSSLTPEERSKPTGRSPQPRKLRRYTASKSSRFCALKQVDADDTDQWFERMPKAGLHRHQVISDRQQQKRGKHHTGKIHPALYRQQDPKPPRERKKLEADDADVLVRGALAQRMRYTCPEHPRALHTQLRILRMMPGDPR